MSDATKSIIDMTLGLGSTAAFAIPGPGVLIATGVQGLGAVFDLLDPDSNEPTDPGSETVTVKKLEDKLGDLATTISKDVWDEFEGKYQTNIIKACNALAQQINHASEDWAFNGTVKGRNEGDIVDWNTNFENFAAFIDSAEDGALTGALIWMQSEHQKEHRFDLLPLYNLAATTFIAMCTKAIIWEYNIALARHDVAVERYQKNPTVKAISQKYDAALVSWAVGGKVGPAPTMDLPADIEIPTVPVKKLGNESEYFATLQQYLPDIVKNSAIPELDSLWVERDRRVRATNGTIAYHKLEFNDVTHYWNTNLVTGESSPKSTQLSDIANDAGSVDTGTAMSAIWFDPKYKPLNGLTTENLNGYKAVLKNWKTRLAQMKAVTSITAPSS